MRWRSALRRRSPSDELVRTARRRLAAISRSPATAPPRPGGWVPQVPPGLDAAVDTAPHGTSPANDLPPSGLGGAVESLAAPIRTARLGLERGHAVVIVVVVVFGLALAAVLLGMGRPDVEPVGAGVSATVVATGTPASGVTKTDSSTDDGVPAELVVHVAGKVRTPGVVRLPAGSRVLDAVAAAGGANKGVDLSGLNLARPLVDGEQVLVGVPPPAGAEPAAPSGGTTAGPVNLNTATTEQLEALPGIGPALAGRIVGWRTEHGRFTSVEELQEVSGIGPATMAELADLVTV